MSSSVKRILDLDIRSMLNPNIWLLIVAVSHTLFGALVPMYKSQLGSTEFISASYGLVIAVVLASIYLFTEGRSLSRMTAVVGGAVFCWIILLSLISEGGDFQLSAELAPPFIYKFSLNIELAPPMLLWGLLSLSGILHWNGSMVEENISNEES
ncbi:MAG: hypothetical protein CMB37_04740 [Euryarchaeota archaeon]|nr:hypothetical protein [Euryarchaeota archaeon]|tara:strand:- start:102 stop:563 length:462 start_codon:yes stop_codon:yes gene_type:complete